MAYLTLPQLAEIPGALELAQVASSAHGTVVAAALMEATLRGTSRSAWTAEQIADADLAKARIEQAIAEAGDVVDGYLARRYSLPLATTPGLLVTWARAITRYKLHQHRLGTDSVDPVVRDYRDAIKFLEQVAAGKFSLGVDDPNAGAAQASEVQFETGSKAFGREFLP